MPFTPTDAFLLLLILGSLGVILFISFRNKKGKNKCHGCPYLKACTKNSNSCNENKK